MSKNVLKDRKIKGVKVTTPIFRVSFPHIFETTQYNESSKPYYTLDALFAKDQDITSIKNAIKAAGKEAFGSNVSKYVPKENIPLKNGDSEKTKKLKGYEGHVFIKPKSYKKVPVIDQNKERLTDPDSIYPGCYARAVVVFKATTNGSNYYISCYLQALQFVKDGERFDSGVNFDSDFDDLEDMDTDLDLGDDDTIEDVDDSDDLGLDL